MNAALWLLIGLQLRGWLRFFFRRLLTVKGAMLAILGLTFFTIWVLSLLIANKTTRTDVEPSMVLRTGPAVLLLYCFMNVVMSSGERGIYFTPAEVNFLFPAPVGRRSLLAYKVVSSMILGLPSSLILAALSYGVSTSFLTAFTGMMLIVLFMQLFTMAINLLAVSVGARLFSRGRKVFVAAVLLLAALIVWQVGGDPATWPVRAWLRGVEQSTIWQTITLPLSWFFKTFNAERIWPDLVVYASLGLLVNGVLLGVVFALDAHYMEAAATASARIYARIRRVRSDSGGAAPSGLFRFSLPMPPALGGIGAICWRQLITTLRMPARLILVFVMFLLVLGISQATQQHPDMPLAMPLMAGGTVLMTAVFFTAMIPFDFRGDVDRLALLKSLPIAPWRLALGQVLTPVLLVTTLQWLVLTVLYFWGVADGTPMRGSSLRPGTIFVICGAFALPVNGMLFAMENLLFLLFPTRVQPNNPADFQALGRNVLVKLAQVCVLSGVFLIAGMVGIMIGVFFPILGLVMAWLTIAFFTSPLIPLIGWAFTIFDVGRDTPA